MAGYDPYGPTVGGSSYGMAPDLQFYSGATGATSGTGMHSSTATGMGSMSHLGGSGVGSSSGNPASFYADATGNMQSGGVGGVMLAQGGFWSAFTAAPLYENEQPLLEGMQILYIQ